MNRYRFAALAVLLALVITACSSPTPAAPTAAPAAAVGSADDSVCKGIQDPKESITPSQTKSWNAPAQVVDPANKYCAIITTERGRIVAELYPQIAPKNVNSFVFLAQQGYYDNITWHRVLPGFVAQTGDPTGNPPGTGSPGFSVPLEINPNLKYDREGRIGMARTNDPDSASSQFFIAYGPLPSLDPHSKELPDSPGYTIIGQVIEGMSTVRSITALDPQTNPNGKGDKLVSVRVVEIKPQTK
ncbi:MAG: peptidylprolyl isomerase [Anaerolineae bacterium]|nr:peptidylprolyl isomerase [Anaerolineae bacterium]